MPRFTIIVPLLAICCSSSFAAVVLNVNIDNPNSIVFSSTTANSESTFLDIDSSGNGIALVEFFTGNTTTTPPTPPVLNSGAIDVFDSSAGTTRQDLNKIFIDTFDGWDPDDIALFTDNSNLFTMSFDSSKRALTGTAIHNLSGFLGHPSVGDMGDVVVGDPASNLIIGQWRAVSAVPEPSAFLCLGLVGLFAGYRTWRR